VPRDARVWRVRARSDETPPKKAMFVLGEDDAAGEMLAVRMPSSSRAVAVLDGLKTG
jgi:hypothetical protein